MAVLGQDRFDVAAQIRLAGERIGQVEVAFDAQRIGHGDIEVIDRIEPQGVEQTLTRRRRRVGNIWMCETCAGLHALAPPQGSRPAHGAATCRSSILTPR